MTKKILLALALTLGTASIAIPEASACGGYYPETAEDRAVREAVETFARRHRADEQQAYVYGVVTDGARASAQLSFTDRRGEARVRQVRLHLRDGRWRIVSVLG